jgi:hypothetical protein
MAAKTRKDFARYDWDFIAPIGAQTVTAKAGNNFCAFCGKNPLVAASAAVGLIRG